MGWPISRISHDSRLDGDCAYGNALSDIAGYAMAGIPKHVTFIIGEEAGADGTVAIAGEDWVAHRASQIPDGLTALYSRRR